jgi:glycosyltransferase involved in cell wall biosynthesis
VKILILAAYYNRPNMIRRGLESVKMQSHQDWELAFCDDGSVPPGKPIVDEIFGDDPRVVYYRLEDSVQQKYAQGGSRHGQMLNEAMVNSKADICIILCDDDALYPGYLEGLSDFYENNPDINYSYSHVSIYNPLDFPGWDNLQDDYDNFINGYEWPINPVCQVDASQVSWRRKRGLYNGVLFPAPMTAALDAAVYGRMFSVFGPCVFNGLTAQYKGIFHGQMGNRGDLFTAKDSE